MSLIPELAELVAMRGAARGLTLAARQTAYAPLQGSHRSAHRGRGLEFEEVRPYVAGDDARNIDWHVTARRGRPHTKLFREERECPVWLLADLHPGLYFGSRRQLKSALLLRAAALLAWTAALGGDRVGAVLPKGTGGAGGTPQLWPPRGREAGVLPILQALVQSQPRAPGTPDASGLAACLSALQAVVRPGSRVLVLSDFSGLDDASETALSALSTRAECRLFWLCDPLESQGMPAGAFRVGVPGRHWWLDGASSRAAWQAAWSQRERRLNDVARNLRLPLARLNTGDDLIHTLPADMRAWA